MPNQLRTFLLSRRFCLVSLVFVAACGGESSPAPAYADPSFPFDAGSATRSSGEDAAFAIDVQVRVIDAPPPEADGRATDATGDIRPLAADTRTEKPDAPSPLPERVCGLPDETVLVKDFDTKYPSCTHLRGNLHMPDASDPRELRHVQTLRRIDGRFTVFRSHGLSNLRGLERLEYIGGELSLRSNSLGGLADTAKLTSLDGLSSLTELGGLALETNRELQDLSGLSGPAVVHGNVLIRYNRVLPAAEIAALLARIRVEGTVTVEANGP